MCNADDLTTATDLHPTFLANGHAAAQDLGLPQATAAFSLTSVELERQYLDLFATIASEVRASP